MIEKNLPKDTVDKIKSLKENCKDLHLPTPLIAYYNVTAYDENDNEIFNEYDITHTLTYNYYKLLGSIVLQNTVNSTVYADNTFAMQSTGEIISSPFTGSPLYFYEFENVANLTQGILIGTGTLANNGNFIKMQSQVTSGNWQMEIPTAGSILPIYDSEQRRWTKTIYKKLRNMALYDNYTISEIGLLLRYGVNENVAKQYLIDRTSLTTPLYIGRFGSFKAQYILTMDLAE
jgi:hypothetical protein